MQKRSAFLGVMAVLLLSVFSQAQMQIYGAWHCGSDYCTWASVRNMTDFDTKNHWLINRGDGSGLPSVNLVILSFVQPLKFAKPDQRFRRCQWCARRNEFGRGQLLHQP